MECFYMTGAPHRRYIAILRFNMVRRQCNLDISIRVPSSQVLLYMAKITDIQDYNTYFGATSSSVNIETEN